MKEVKMKFLPEKFNNSHKNDGKFPPLDQLKAWAAIPIPMNGSGEAGRPVL
jgi:hypothetical protein